MRNIFLQTLTELATDHREIMFLTGDLGFGVVERFRDQCPNQFINMGAAEQNMVGVATGLASRGFIPFTYSIINFSVLRPLEFIRNGPIAHQVPVRIVGVGPGFEYGSNGPTHYGVEDIACLRSFGGIDIHVPADIRRAKKTLERVWDVPHPLYFRLSKDDKLVVPELDDATDCNGFSVFTSDLETPAQSVIVCLGSAIEEGLKARRLLSRRAISTDLICVEVINDDTLMRLATHIWSHRSVVSVEAHAVRGGMGSALAECLGELGGDRRIRRLGIQTIPNFIGTQKTLEHASGYDASGIVAAVESMVMVEAESAR